MAAYMDKERINTAITDSTKFDLSHVHITTSNFMQLQPIYNKEMVPGEKISVNIESFARMNPLPVPTFGRAVMKNRAYFVPFRTIYRGWNDFITDAPHTNSAGIKGVNLLPSVPFFTNQDLVLAFQANYFAYGQSDTGMTAGTSLVYDFILSQGGSNSYKKFTPVGRLMNKVLESLGYKVNWNSADETDFSALPLLALAKVYTDWYFPSAYTNSTDYSNLLLLCNQDTSSPVQLGVSDLQLILQQCLFVCYDSDYFTSAWDNPTCPGAGKVSGDYRLNNIDYVGNGYYKFTSTPYTWDGSQMESGYVTNNTGTASATGQTIGGLSAPFISPLNKGTVVQISSGGQQTSIVNSTVPAAISEYMLHSLHALTDYLKRHQLAGSRAMDRYLARYGKALPAEKLNRSVYLGCQTVPVQIGDVMSNSDTEGAGLGAYAGKGIAYGDNGKFSFSTDEFGMFIVLSSIDPAVGYYQGINPQVKRLHRLDFWTPEFEALGTEPIPADVLYMTNDGGSALADVSTNADYNIHEHIFGFTPRYSSYKCAFDQVTGNLRVPSLFNDASTNNGTASWHLMRRFDDGDFVDASGNNSILSMVHSLDFVYSRGDLGDYNRIFDNKEPDAPDQFTVIHQFDIGDYAPMKPLYNGYDWQDKGHKVTLDVNGAKHN